MDCNPTKKKLISTELKFTICDIWLDFTMWDLWFMIIDLILLWVPLPLFLSTVIENFKLSKTFQTHFQTNTKSLFSSGNAKENHAFHWTSKCFLQALGGKAKTIKNQLDFMHSIWNHIHFVIKTWFSRGIYVFSRFWKHL